MKIDHSSQLTRRTARMRPSCFAALLPRLVCAVLLIFVFALIALPQSKYEKRRIAKVDITLGDTDKDQRAIEQYRLIVRVLLNGTYSIPRIRDAITALYETKQIDTVSVSAALDTAGDVELLFTIKRKTQAGKVSVVVGPSIGDPVTESDLLYKLNLITPGAILTEQILQNNADEILSYLRERGYYQSQVTYERRPLEYGNEVGVTFRVTPATQARVGELTFRIEGYNKPIPPQALRLRKGELYSRERRLSDFAKIRELLREDDFLAPELEDPDVIYDGDTNTISVEFAGKAGPIVKVIVESEENKVGSDTQMRILPVKREGTLDYSAIVEGERRLENYFQEKGYFFANVTPVCSADPPLIDAENNTLANGSESLCNVLGGEDLKGRSIEIKYLVDPNRRLTLQRLRLRGTDKMTIEDVKAVLSSQEANILGIIPIFGYGRGYTSQSILETDAETVRTLMAELGYRDASVRVTQGVSPNGEDLIITFVVDDGVPSIVKQVSFVGNRVLDSNQLRAVIPNIEGQNYSRAKERNAVQKLRETYSDLGYYDARVTSKVYGLEGEPAADRRDVRIEFKVDSEGRKVVINRILVRGVDNTKTEAVLRALTLRPGELLRTADIYSSEQNLYSTDAFSRIEIKPQPAGDDPNGNRLTDIIVSLEEQPPRLMSYGGGFSTDLGLSGFFDLRHVNLFGSLWQGGTRVKMSQRQQLVQFDFINPRFIRDGDKKWAPLTLTALYQRDTTVTRFFRSAFDKGTFGIVQRVDEDGNPIDEFGNAAGDPTINRAAFSAETSRTISRKDRSILFVRYKFEDVRLYDIESLLIADLLRPDRYTRLSGFGATFVRDTRKNCSPKYTLLDLIAKGEPSDPCRYSAGDPTKGQYLTADYSVSVPALGANIGFHKFQATYNYFYTIPKLKNTTLAARGILGLASVFSGGDRYTDSDYPWLNGLLPISERFFAGGSNSIRGFDFEEAGPRVVIVPEGSFIDSNGDPIFLDPFTVPFGGNGLAVVNLEARIPVSRSLRLVPFYDGGNVYKNAGDIFKRPSVSPSDLNRYNQRGIWTHTVGVGLRVKTPLGGDFGVDYGHQLNPPTFLIPQSVGPPAVYRLKQGQLHFRFSQAF